ncbi:hypothetical protein GCM10008024_31860 [Allgaiera indica]|uniref:Uncharacterized protein n=1 Tax=Allgaiera indica TaxID=765699 RepID=A0AAN4UTX1_9RHOB|nr:hypothetical protein GCM10008024_31860 [Allgaiera indica]
MHVRFYAVPTVAAVDDGQFRFSIREDPDLLQGFGTRETAAVTIARNACPRCREISAHLPRNTHYLIADDR